MHRSESDSPTPETAVATGVFNSPTTTGLFDSLASAVSRSRSVSDGHGATLRQNGIDGRGTVGGTGHDIQALYGLTRRLSVTESPLHRAGLLQPKSYNSSPYTNHDSSPTAHRHMHVAPHSQDTIRLNTMQLSNMVFSSSITPRDPEAGPIAGPGGDVRLDDPNQFIFPGAVASRGPSEDLTASLGSLRLSESLGTRCSVSSSSLSPPGSIRTSSETPSGASTPRPHASLNSQSSLQLQSPFQPSGLSILRQKYESISTPPSPSSPPKPVSDRLSSAAVIPGASVSGAEAVTPMASLTPIGTPNTPTRAQASSSPSLTFSLSPSAFGYTPTTSVPPPIPSSVKRGHAVHWDATPMSSTSSETTSLLTPAHPVSSYYTTHSHLSRDPEIVKRGAFLQRVKAVVTVQKARDITMVGVKSLPAVLLGTLLNILDGVSYGMIIFPATGVFAGLGPMGVSMFFVSTVLAQFIYTLGGSEFAGANGSMMIEVVPFFHILATSIAKDIGEDNLKEIIATTLVAFALSSVLTGLSFFLLGALRLGVLVGFFPRHILVGCIGGVGAFLIITGLSVSLRISEDDFDITWESLKYLFVDLHNLALWLLPLGLAVLLRLITHKFHHQLVFPLYFIAVPIVFYIVVAAAQLNLEDLRRDGWVFEMIGGHEAWYRFYSYFDYSAVRFAPLWSTLPTQFALLFFNILHPPLNVPALSVSLNEDIDTDKELVGHGYSNFIAGIFGTVPNYLVYVNTLMFCRVGGGTRIAGFLLAVATCALLFIGPGPIAFIPVMVVGSLIFVLGIDLVKEALWDTRHRVTRMEYITIVSIMVCMTVWDFVIGVLFGIIVSCFFFVVQNSQRRSIRSLHTGEAAMSTVRRPSFQRAYIREVSKQTTILRLQGFLFFGTITYVEEAIRGVIDGPSWQRNPVQFLVLDLSLVAGVDMSSAEAFVRVQRLLSAKCVTLVFCGFSEESAVGMALQSVGVLGADGVELFSTFNDAMEWTENAYLRAWLRSQKSESTPTNFALPGRQDADIDSQRLMVGSFVSSPRRSHLREVGDRTIANELRLHLETGNAPEPHNTLVKAFSSYGEINFNQFRKMESYLQRTPVPGGLVLWKQDDPSDGLYIVESGVLRASYQFAHNMQTIEESMVPGAVAGELSALSGLPRNATVIVERPAILWKLSSESLLRLETEEPELARTFLRLVLKAAKMDHDILLAALASRH